MKKVISCLILLFFLLYSKGITHENKVVSVSILDGNTVYADSGNCTIDSSQVVSDSMSYKVYLGSVIGLYPDTIDLGYVSPDSNGIVHLSFALWDSSFRYYIRIGRYLKNNPLVESCLSVDSTRFVGLRGDVNEDGIVNGVDLNLIAEHWNNSGYSIYDITGDRKVDWSDLYEIFNRMGYTNRTLDPDSNTVFLWKFNQTLYSETSFGDSIITKVSPYYKTALNGRVGGLDFDGSTQLAEKNADSSLVAKTVEMLIKPETAVSSDTMMVCSTYGMKGFWGFYVDGSDSLFKVGYIDTAGTNTILSAKNKLQVNKWYYIASVYSDSLSEIKLYINGVIKDSSNVLSPAIPSGITGWNIADSMKVWIGAIKNTSGVINYPWDGVVDELSISTKAKNFEDIKNTMLRMKGKSQ